MASKKKVAKKKADKVKMKKPSVKAKGGIETPPKPPPNP